MIGKLALTVALALSCTLSFAYIVDGSRVNQPKLLSYVKDRLPNQGTLQQTAQGYAYLKVSDQYITDLIRQLSSPGFQPPTPLNAGKVHGAHISVMYEGEAKNLKLQELGQTVRFNPLGFYTVVIDDLEYFMLAVDAPELSEIRQKYGLDSKIHNHAFHITIAVRKFKAVDQLATAEDYQNALANK